MDEYLKIINNDIHEYMKIILDNKYHKNICDDFCYVYIDSAYYGTYINHKKNKQKDELKEEIEKIHNKLIEEDLSSEKSKTVAIIYDFFEHVILLEKTYRTDKFEDVLETIIELRKEKLNKEDLDFKEKLISKVRENIHAKKEFLDRFETKDFYLQKKKLANNLYKIDIKHNIKFPMIYSDNAINETFNNGLISEDKLFIEYILSSIQVIEDIENGIYNEDYIINFASSIFEKKQKLNRLLEIIDNYALQDRLSILINYKDFLKFKEEICEFIKSGYKIAIKIDKYFIPENIEIERLKIFKFCLISKKSDFYKDVCLKKNILNNIIEI
jgi:Fe-S cluster assembly scaffold protein SufB